MNQQLIEKIVGEVLGQLEKAEALPPNDLIPIAVSARHVHLSLNHVEALFGKGYELTVRTELSQPGQFASNETVVIAGPKGSIERVRILGPARSMTQAEISWTDAMKLGVNPPIRESGDIEGSEAITIIGPKGSLFLEQGLIIAQAHIHMSPKDAARFGVQNGEYVTVETDGIRPIAYRQVKIRVSERYRLEMHIDTDEANASLITKGAFGHLVKFQGNLNVQQETSASVTKSKVDIPYIYPKKLLSRDDVKELNMKEIILEKGTIITALARDTARELGISVSFRK
ncbi:putative phosphotransacetylase [Psychrobacillus sp. OK028]|uniref:phosphate propanoyltransferase n=1 Tax=Psychrobacillus sp. OK028 TaxID=1884359 RepID=UPI0008844DD6|nr:phosphate propanoyltransferase [Psychrobacillus sp. OK028]SDN90614.1 putative phosphotransacetylase [Psychrobacillus sp. OK028]